MRYIHTQEVEGRKKPHLASLDLSKPKGHMLVIEETDTPLERFEYRGPADMWGLFLDGEYLVIDLDDMNSSVCQKAYNELPPTFTQKTKRGYHFIYKVGPEVSKERKTVIKWQGHSIDVKVNGWIVGPGSVREDGTVHTVVNAMPPQPAPTELIEKYTKAKPAPIEKGPARTEFVPNGKHEKYLFDAACALRGRFGADAKSMVPLLRGLISAFQDYDETNPFTDAFLLDKAERACAFVPEFDTYIDISTATDDEKEAIVKGCSFDIPVFDWYIYGFIPKGPALITGFAPGGIGKSTAGQYLASIVTAKHNENFLVINHEDLPEYWKACSVVAGADPDKLYSHEHALSIRSPKDVMILEKIILDNDIKVVWFDSIKDHFSPEKNADAATAARSCLSPLSSLAKRTGCLIVGIFHTNKKGLPGGSTEMLNVARHVLEFSRKKGEDLILRVDKTNIQDPQAVLRLRAELTPLIDPKDPTRMVTERTREGKLQPRSTYVIKSHEEDSAYLQELEDEKEKKATIAKIMELKSEGLSQKAIGDHFGKSQAWVSKILAAENVSVSSL